MARKFRKRAGGRFLQLHMWMLETSAWKDLSVGARAAYVELKAKYNGTNNGSIGMGVRDLAEQLNVSKSTAARHFTELEEHGFVVRAAHTTFNTKRYATEWLLTEAKDDRTGALATKTFARWKKQKPVPNRTTPGSLKGLSQNNGTMPAPDSPAVGPASDRTSKKQSHPRDPYTSTPDGNASTLNDALPLGSRDRDPLVAAVLKTFPTARVLNVAVRKIG